MSFKFSDGNGLKKSLSVHDPDDPDYLKFSEEISDILKPYISEELIAALPGVCFRTRFFLFL